MSTSDCFCALASPLPEVPDGPKCMPPHCTHHIIDDGSRRLAQKWDRYKLRSVRAVISAPLRDARVLMSACYVIEQGWCCGAGLATPCTRGAGGNSTAVAR